MRKIMKSFPVFHLLHVLIFVLSTDNNEYSCDHYISPVESNLYVRISNLFRFTHCTYWRVIYGPRQANLVLIAYASSKGSGEPAHPSRQNLRCSLIQAVQELPSDRKQDPWPLWMAGHLHTAHTGESYMDRVKRIWYLSHMRAAKVLARLRGCAGLPEPSLLA